MMDDSLKIWTVIRDPSDLPGVAFCARQWVIAPGGTSTPMETVLVAPTLDALREMLPPGLVKLARSPHDEPAIVESWI